MQAVMNDIMSGKTTDAQIGGFLTALATKGEANSEIIGAVRVMRKLSTKVVIENNKYLVDTCGTGGDGLGIFNVSTAASFVVASSGAKVAKHGNRSISSKSGSADLLEAAGANLNMSAEEVAKSVASINIGFMFAQNHHSAMRYAIGPRKELGVRTIFNLLGPLTNPAGAPNQVIGVYKKELTIVFANVLKELGARHVMVVHSVDGMDEISSFAPTFVSELKEGSITNYEINPTDFVEGNGKIADIVVGDSEASLKIIQEVLDGKQGPAFDMVAINSGATIYVSGKAKSLQEGVAKAKEILTSGAAHQKLEDFVRTSTGC
jgi:anthranilate phosphoribosyltransferase